MESGRERLIQKIRIGAMLTVSSLTPLAYLTVTSLPNAANAVDVPGRDGPATRTVLVTLKDAPDERPLGARAEEAKREEILEEQTEVLEEADIDAGDAEQHWVGGVMAVEATEEQIAELEANPDVAAVEPEPVVEIVSGVKIAAQSSPGDGNWGVGASGSDRVWDDFGLTGTGVIVGSIDTGIEATHPSVSGKVVAWKDTVNGLASPYDDNGHGTHTASTIAGRAINGAPIGVAPDAKLVVAKAIGASGSAPGSQLLAAAQWMADPDGNPATPDHPTIINNSWTAGDGNDTWFRSIVRHWRSLGIVPIFAAGNSGPGPGTVGSPASYPESFAVGAVDEDQAATSFSSRGPIQWTNQDGTGPAAGTVLIKPDVSAPGQDIVGAVPGGYATFSGTSMASPHIAGVAALVRQAKPASSVDEVVSAIANSSTDAGPAGKDSSYGMGMLDAPGAVSAVGAIPVTGIDARFTKTPPSRTRARSLGYQVSLIGATAYHYRVDGGAWSPPITSPKFAVRASQGRHVVEVRAADALGTTDAKPSRHVVIVDRSRPAARVSWTIQGSRVVFRAAVRDRGTGVRNRNVVWRLGKRTKKGRVFVHRFRGTQRTRVRLLITDSAGNRRAVSRRVVLRTPTLARAKSTGRVRRGGRIRIRGVARRSGRVRATLVPIPRRGAKAKTSATGPRLRKVTRVRRGQFAFSVPVGRIAAGRYRLRIHTLGSVGRRERVITRTVRVTGR